MRAEAKPQVYRIYLLTVWQVPSAAQPMPAEWRFHLTDPHTGKRYGCTNVETLIATLQQLARDQPPADSRA